MKNKITLIFEDIGNIITSVYFVIMVMGMVILSGCFLSHILFYRSFPSDMGEWENIIASWTFGIAWECTLLIAATNRQHLDNENFVKVFAICSGILLLFFIDAFNTSFSFDLVNCIQKYFAALLIGFVNYTYSELFYRKWTEHINKSEFSKFEIMLKEYEVTINSLKHDLKLSQVKLLETQIKSVRNKETKKALEIKLQELIKS
jgi:hypothetical protein